MAKKLNREEPAARPNPPENLSQSGFFRRLSFKLTEEQKRFRDAIYSKDNDIVFVNSPAGTGKTAIAVATACCMIEYGLYDRLLYCFTPVNFQAQIGLLPGSIEEKVAPFMEPLYEALKECGYVPETVIKQLNETPDKKGAFVDCSPHTFMRGTNIDDKTILLIDEAENFFPDELKKVLTRVKGGKTIVIGHDGQCDLYKQKWQSGFVPYMRHFAAQPRAAFCELKENHRGWVSNWADEFVTQGPEKEESYGRS